MQLSSKKVMGVLHRKIGVVMNETYTWLWKHYCRFRIQNFQWKYWIESFKFHILQHHEALLFVLEVNLFATFANKQVAKYVSWYPEPASCAVDAIKVDLQGLQSMVFYHLASLGYRFPNSFGKELWGSWLFHIGQLETVSTYNPVSSALPSRNPNYLVVPDYSSKQNHRYPLVPKLKLMAVLLWDIPSKCQMFWMKWEELSVTHGETRPNSVMKRFWKKMESTLY